MSENGREKLLHMQHVTDLTGTDYASLKDIARRLTALSGALVGEAAVSTISSFHAMFRVLLLLFFRVFCTSFCLPCRQPHPSLQSPAKLQLLS